MVPHRMDVIGLDGHGSGRAAGRWRRLAGGNVRSFGVFLSVWGSSPKTPERCAFGVSLLVALVSLGVVMARAFGGHAGDRDTTAPDLVPPAKDQPAKAYSRPAAKEVLAVDLSIVARAARLEPNSPAPSSSERLARVPADKRDAEAAKLARGLCAAGAPDRAVGLVQPLFLQALGAGRPLSRELIGALKAGYDCAHQLAAYERLLDLVPADHPQREALVHSVATAYADAADWRAAGALLRADLEAHGPNVAGLYDLAMVEEAAGDLSAASAARERVAAMQNDPGVYFELGKHYLYLNQTELALAAFANAARRDPGYTEQINAALQAQQARQP